MLKNTIVAASKGHKAQSSSFSSRQLIATQKNISTHFGTTQKSLQLAEKWLKKIVLRHRACFPTLDVASIAMVGGYLVRAARVSPTQNALSS